MRHVAIAMLVAACGGTGAPPVVTDGKRPPSAAQGPRVLDGFEDAAPWKAEASDDVAASAQLVDGVDGKALRLDFDFKGHGGYAIARRKLPLEFPASYELSFDLRGEAPINNLEVKLVDASGQNVWWYRKADYQFPKDWQRIVVKKRHIEFAWGPTRDKELRRAAAIEVVVSAGRGGGAGWIAVDRLEMREVPPPPSVPPAPIARASSAAPDHGAALAVDGRPQTAWHSAGGKQERIELDLGYPREFGGLTLRWREGAHASRYDVEVSQDRATWQVVRKVTGSDGGRDALLLTESEARYLRLTLHEGSGRPYQLGEVEIEDLAFGATPNAFVSALARESPRGRYPRGFFGEQPYWTLVGVEAGRDSGLFSEDGAIEFGKRAFSVEPFVIQDGVLVSWADVEISHGLADGYLPIPSVTWRHPDWELRITALAAGKPEQARLAGRYELVSRAARPIELGLVLAVRPYQVNPPTQFLNLAGGVTPIHALAWDGRALSVERGGQLREGAPVLIPLSRPDHVGLSAFDGGGFPDRPAPSGGREPARVEDSTGLASGALVYQVRLGPGGRARFGVASPLTGTLARSERAAMTSVAWFDRQERRVAASWREKLNRVDIRVPDDGQAVVDTVRSSLAHLLMSREGPVLQPGTRSYARSWIRDGAMISESLLRLGHEATAAEYLRWFAPYQFDSGKVPCCVDARGADPVPENDSAGELIFLVAEIYRFTGDRALLEKMWPHVAGAARHLESMRQSERTDANRTPERRALFGLLPPSISHEGYSAKPAYSYWDDFWGLIGYQDAVAVAEALGRKEDAARLTAQRDEFRRELYESLRATTELHGIAHIPGAADLGDFDPTSTTIALAPGREGPHLPRDLLLPTFERYWKEHGGRQSGTRKWDAYTPYELRVVGTFVRLGWRTRANQLLAFFFDHRRPAAWNQWAEVVGRELREPRFIGDMPHAWVASDYIRSALDMFVYARDADQTLVLAAGVPSAWLDGEGFSVRRLRTPYGPLAYSVKKVGGQVRIQVSGRAPPGGFALPWPFDGPTGPATVNGKAATWKGGELRFSTTPARIAIERR